MEIDFFGSLNVLLSDIFRCFSFDESIIGLQPTCVVMRSNQLICNLSPAWKYYADVN